MFYNEYDFSDEWTTDCAAPFELYVVDVDDVDDVDDAIDVFAFGVDDGGIEVVAVDVDSFRTFSRTRLSFLTSGRIRIIPSEHGELVESFLHPKIQARSLSKVIQLENYIFLKGDRLLQYY